MKLTGYSCAAKLRAVCQLNNLRTPEAKKICASHNRISKSTLGQTSPRRTRTEKSVLPRLYLTILLNNAVVSVNFMRSLDGECVSIYELRESWFAYRSAPWPECSAKCST